MSLFLAQIPTLIGVVIGAVTSYLLTRAAERARWQEQQAIRWDVPRMEAYATYANATKVSVHLAIRVGVGRGLGQIAPPLSIDDGLKELARAVTERGALWERVLLFGDASTIAAGRDWHEHAWTLEWYAEGILTDGDLWAATIEAANKARGKFYECARRSLGMPYEDLPDTGWTRRFNRFDELTSQDPPAPNT